MNERNGKRNAVRMKKGFMRWLLKSSPRNNI